MVWYCSSNCQKMDWIKHKSLCKEAQARKKANFGNTIVQNTCAAATRRQVYRAAVILQEIFYIFGRITNMWTIARIDKSKSTWFLHPPKTWEGKSQLIPFPPACVKTAQEEKALLSYQQCQSALFRLHDLTKLLLHDMRIKQGIIFQVS